jgi:hypothetical protein
LRFDAESTEASSQLARVERTTGVQTHEEPGGGRDRGRKGGVVPVLVQLPAKQVVEWRGDFDIRGAEPQSGGAVDGDRHLVAPKGSDARELLAVEEHEATGDPVGEVDTLVVKQLADD